MQEDRRPVRRPGRAARPPGTDQRGGGGGHGTLLAPGGRHRPLLRGHRFRPGRRREDGDPAGRGGRGERRVVHTRGGHPRAEGLAELERERGEHLRAPLLHHHQAPGDGFGGTERERDAPRPDPEVREERGHLHACRRRVEARAVPAVRRGERVVRREGEDGAGGSRRDTDQLDPSGTQVEADEDLFTGASKPHSWSVKAGLRRGCRRR